MRAALAKAIPIACQVSGLSSPNESKGTMRTMGTMQRSWKIKVPTIKRPWGASNSPRSPRVRRTKAVLDKAKTKPYTIACGVERPKPIQIAKVTSAVTLTWIKPPRATWRKILRKRARENSRPIVKSRKITPTSAITSMASGSWASESALGPTRAPESTSPATTGSLSRPRIRVTNTLTVAITVIS